MEFGRVQTADGLTLSLPADDSSNPGFLGSLRDSTASKLRVGCPVWAQKDFAKAVYPEGTKAKDYLKAYASVFPALELNATHYAIPPVERVSGWQSQVSPDFRFCPKIPKQVSHAHAPSQEAIDATCDAFLAFGNHLGPVLLQVPPTLDIGQKRRLAFLLAALSERLPLALELRHPEWFSDRPQFERLVAYLRDKGIGLVITDTPGRRDVLHMCLTASFCMVRFVGNALHESDYERIDAWKQRIARWQSQGLSEVFFFMHQQEEAHGAVLARHFQEYERCRS